MGRPWWWPWLGGSGGRPDALRLLHQRLVESPGHHPRANLCTGGSVGLSCGWVVGQCGQATLKCSKPSLLLFEKTANEMFSRGVSGIFSRPVGKRKNAPSRASAGPIELQSVACGAPATALPLLDDEARAEGHH